MGELGWSLASARDRRRAGVARERGLEARVCPMVAATRENRRAEFFTETATHLMTDVRSLRDSGIP